MKIEPHHLTALEEAIKAMDFESTRLAKQGDIGGASYFGSFEESLKELREMLTLTKCVSCQGEFLKHEMDGVLCNVCSIEDSVDSDDYEGKW